MKITLHNPPEGFEAEAEIRRPLRGESYLSNSDEHVFISSFDCASTYIVLTPKKRKYWRLDPVATFEEATLVTGCKTTRYGYYEGELGGCTNSTSTDYVQWLKLTECEE
jgi:hypothetical protein